MIAEGCMNEVDEVYGMHNWPSHICPYLMVKPGPVMSEVSLINITLFGKGGHASKPELAIDPT